MNVAVIGASDKPERFSYQALALLKQKGHKVFPVHQRLKTKRPNCFDGEKVYTSIKDIDQPIDTITLYVNADISSNMAADVFSVKPKRIIFNPGAENPDLAQKAKMQGIATINDCTLVMLRAGQF